MADEEKRPELKKIPENTLDFNMELLNPVWGKEEYISDDLKDKLSKITYYEKPDGTIVADKQSLYGILSHYTRDMRLANIDRAQLVYCSYYIDLAGDFLQVDMVEPFLICISRSATQLELSQSRDGFLRKRQTTLTTEEYKKELEPGKKSLLTGKGRT